MSNSLPSVNSSDDDRVFTPEEVAAAAHERVVLLELCLKLNQYLERETTSLIAAAAAHERVVLLELCLKLNPYLERETTSLIAAAAAGTHHPQECVRYRYPPITEPNGKVRLRVIEGEITDSQIIVVLGTTTSVFLPMVGPTLTSSNGEIPKLAFKHRKNFLNKTPFAITVRDLLNLNIRDSCMNPKFVYYVMEPLLINNLLMDKLVNDLSPGQLQSLSLCICLGKPADIYLIDKPSTYLDMPQRIATARVIKWFMRREKKAAFVAENEFKMASYLADRIIVVEGQPCIDYIANAPESVLTGAELVLSKLDTRTLLTYKQARMSTVVK